VADGFYLAGYMPLVIGLVLLVRARTPGRDVASLIDAAIIATGLGLLSWVFLIKPAATDGTLGILGRAASMAYPTADVLLIALLARLLIGAGVHNTAFRLLAGSLVIMLAGDVGFAVLAEIGAFTNNNAINITWLLAYVLFGARRCTRRWPSCPSGRWSRRARRTSTPLALALLDLVHFKQFNDRYGHQAGDQLLKSATATWQAMLRPSDLLARLGGEEFGLILPTATMDQAVEIVDRLRTATPLGESFSAGVALWDGNETSDQIVARADHALYQAKQADRNQVLPAGTRPGHGHARRLRAAAAADRPAT
jgi:diguanylate cyclase